MKKNKKSIIPWVIVALILLAINISYVINNILSEPKSKYEVSENANTSTNTNTNTTQSTVSVDEAYMNRLKKMGERDRMEHYFGKYITYIEKKEYEKAYDLLYPEFKNRYFKTIDEYKTYIQEKYPKEMISVNYNNIERQGEYYVLFLEIVDLSNSSKNDEKKISQKAVIYEKDYDDFVLSFDVQR